MKDKNAGNRILSYEIQQTRMSHSARLTRRRVFILIGVGSLLLIGIGLYFR